LVIVEEIPTTRLLSSASIMSTPPILQIAAEFLCSVLTFSAVLVLFASTIGILMLIARQVIRTIRGIVDMAIDASPTSAEPYVKTLNPLGVAVERRVRQIPGAHNERF
jgi:hypothetical protein